MVLASAAREGCAILSALALAAGKSRCTIYVPLPAPNFVGHFVRHLLHDVVVHELLRENSWRETQCVESMAGSRAATLIHQLHLAAAERREA